MQTCLYALIERRPGHSNSGLPFYVGIGARNRPRAHLRIAKTQKGCSNELLTVAIRGHFAAGVDPEIRILSTFVMREDACAAEREAISRYGRIGRDEGGILCNVARGGDGPDLALSKEADMRAKISSRAREAIHEPGVRERHVAALRRISASISPEQKSEWGKNVSEEVRQKRIAALEASRRNPDDVAKRAAATSVYMKESWADPEISAKRKSAFKGVKKTRTEASDAARRANSQKGNTPEANAKKAEASRLRWADPEFRALMAAKKATAWQDPEKRANMLRRPSKGSSHVYRDSKARAPDVRNALRRERYKRAKEDSVHEQVPG